jgi:hypothetical protein
MIMTTMEKGKPVNQEFHTSISFTRSCWPSWKRVQSCAVSVCKHRLTVIDNWPVTYHNIYSTGSHPSKLGEGKQCAPVVRLMVSQVSVPVECVLGANQLGSAVPALGLKSGQTCSRQASIERRMLRQSQACMQTDLKYLSISKWSCDVSCLCCCRCHSSSSSSDSLLSSLCDCLCLRPFFSHVAIISVIATNTAQSLRKLQLDS